MKYPHEFSIEQVMELLDTATDALELINSIDLGESGRISERALELIGKRTEEFMKEETK